MAVESVSYEKIVHHLLMDKDYFVSDEAEFAEAMFNADDVTVTWDILGQWMQIRVRRIGLFMTDFIMNIGASSRNILWVARAMTDASNEICGATLPVLSRAVAVMKLSDRVFCPHCDDIGNGGHQYMTVNGVGAMCPKCGEDFWSFGEYIATSESDPYAFDED